MKEHEREINISQSKDQDSAIFDIEEIKIEEMAIDGICGVY
ncbi:MAG: variant-type mycofactocin precursor [Syntrophobacteraceae bacterium]|nr:variant-type mycofactocin precursor [Syntrophobacteraceae bacterium]